MRCRECESLLWSYVDGELAEGQRQTVEGHLAGCPRCTLAFERLRAFPLRLGHLTAVAPPPDFTTRLMRRIEPLPPPRERLYPVRLRCGECGLEAEEDAPGWLGRLRQDFLPEAAPQLALCCPSCAEEEFEER